jgi:hypothetical protein
MVFNHMGDDDTITATMNSVVLHKEELSEQGGMVYEMVKALKQNSPWLLCGMAGWGPDWTGPDWEKKKITGSFGILGPQWIHKIRMGACEWDPSSQTAGERGKIWGKIHSESGRQPRALFDHCYKGRETEGEQGRGTGRQV